MPHPTDPHTPPDRAPTAEPIRRSPLPTVLAVTALGSLGTGGITNGIFFLAKSALGFETIHNAALGVLMGVTYIAGALGVGPAVRLIAARSSAISTRAVLIALHIALGLLALVPWLGSLAQGGPRAWHLVLMCALYMPLTGAVWPIVESHLSGGRRGSMLRAATGRFNIVWSASVAASFWLMAPLVERAPLLVLALLGATHLITLPLLLALPREPGRHLDEVHEPHPPVYERLLRVVRPLLPTSYFVAAALGVYLPAALDRLAVPLSWQTPVASASLTTRVLIFFLMERWHGWHGRWWPINLAAALMLAGFAAAVLAPRMPTDASGLAMLLVGLVTFGAGMAAIYCAALYYAMEVGAAAVDAGGMHEALIGLGYTIGPAATLAVALAVARGLVPEPARETALTLLVTLLALSALGIARRRAR